MDDFIQYLLVTDQLDEIFLGKEKEEDDELILKRTLENKEINEDNSK